MMALSKTQILLGMAVLVVAGAVITVVVRQRQAAPPPVAQNAAPSREVTGSTLADAQKQATAVVTALGGAAVPPEANDGVPSFDIARIETSGEAVIAGRATPGAAVELLRNDEVLDRAVANADGQFVMVPSKPLPAGNYSLTLRAKKSGGDTSTSKQSVAVALAANSQERPVVALMTPDKPTVVLSQPGAAKQPSGAIVVEAVEVQGGGKLHVSGRARPGASARFYLNDTFIAAATAGSDGRFAITINEGVAPGNYRVRLDEVEARNGAVRARAEVPFNVPAAAVAAGAPAVAAKTTTEVAAAKTTAVPPAPLPPASTATAAAAAPAPAARVASEASTAAKLAMPAPVAATAQKAASQADAAKPQLAAAAPPLPASAPPSNVVVEKINTATVTRGDSLWRISQTTYGAGMRYAVIYEANQTQIRDPDLIYPGQIFVLPAQ